MELMAQMRAHKEALKEKIAALSDAQRPLRWVNRVISWCADKRPSFADGVPGAEGAAHFRAHARPRRRWRGEPRLFTPAGVNRPLDRRARGGGDAAQHGRVRAQAGASRAPGRASPAAQPHLGLTMLALPEEASREEFVAHQHHVWRAGLSVPLLSRIARACSRRRARA